MACVVLATLALLSPGCRRQSGDTQVLITEKAQWTSHGWEFVTVVGTARGSVEAREIRHSDPETGILTVIAPASGLPGESRGPEQKRTFHERGYRFLEVKIMTGPADGYGIIFRQKTA